jgi:hypothetical protein
MAGGDSPRSPAAARIARAIERRVRRVAIASTAHLRDVLSEKRARLGRHRIGVMA